LDFNNELLLVAISRTSTRPGIQWECPSTDIRIRCCYWSSTHPRC